MNPRHVCVLFIIFRATFAFSSEQAGACSVHDTRTTPYRFPIVLSGNLPIAGHDVRNLIALSWQNRKWQRIPIQIDQRNAKDEYVLADGLPFTKDSDDFFFDANDELVFAGRHLGQSFTKKDLQHITAQSWLKNAANVWQINTCQNKKFLGALLLASVPNTPKLRSAAAVVFDEVQKKVTSPYYRYEFHDKKAALLGKIFLKDGTKEVEAIASSSFMMIAKLPWFLPNMQLDENSFESEIESWQSGPVRTIVAVGVKFKNFLSFLNLHMFSELVFYEGLFQIPTEIHFPIEAKKLLKPGSGLAYAIHFWRPDDWKIETNMTRLPPRDPQWVVDHVQELSPQKLYFARGTHSSREWSFMTKVRVDEKAVRSFPPPLLLQRADFEDKNIAMHWPWVRQLKGDWGVFLDLSKVNRGVYDFGLDLVLRTEAYQDLTDYDSARAFWQSYL